MDENQLQHVKMKAQNTLIAPVLIPCEKHNWNRIITCHNNDLIITYNLIFFYLGHLFLTGILEQSIFGLLILKPNIKRLLAWYNLISLKNYHAGLNPLRIMGAKIRQKLVLCLGPCDP